jgi:hypothetical protein
MRRSVVGLVSAGAIAFATGGYAFGAMRGDGAAERSAMCEQAKQEFGTRAGQIRKQLQRESRGEEADSRQAEMDAARVRILSAVVAQNPACFDVGTRATTAVLRQHPSEGEADATVCDLTGIQPDECSIAVD